MSTLAKLIFKMIHIFNMPSSFFRQCFLLVANELTRQAKMQGQPEYEGYVCVCVFWKGGIGNINVVG